MLFSCTLTSVFFLLRISPQGFRLPGVCCGCPGELPSRQQLAGAAGAGGEHGDAGRDDPAAHGAGLHRRQNPAPQTQEAAAPGELSEGPKH